MSRLAHVPYASDIIATLSKLKQQARAIESESSGLGQSELVATVSEMETHVHKCLEAIEEFKQDFIDDYATTIFDRRRNAAPGPNPFSV